jgi:cation transport regulator ChaC
LADASWIFGYGSLVWRPDFSFAERRPGYIEGYVRRFWQGSTDHRGVPTAPGRVVTLVPEPGARCWGIAYRLSSADRQRVFGVLDVREKGGYARSAVTVHFDGSARERVSAVLYLATADNPNYLGPAPVLEIAQQILRASGPSGSNAEYVLRLAGFLREVGAEEPHVYEIEHLLRDRSGGLTLPGGG